MSLDKFDVKMGTASEIGNRMDDMREATIQELHRLEGTVTAFQAAAVSLETLGSHVNKDIEEGKFDLEVAKHIQRYTTRAHQLVLNLSKQAENNRMTQQGKVYGLEAAIKVTKKYHDDEASKIMTLRLALQAQKLVERDGSLESVGTGASPVGVHPNMTLKEQRLLEEQQEKLKQEAATPSEPEKVEVLLTPEKVEVKEVKKTKGAKKNAHNAR